MSDKITLVNLFQNKSKFFLPFLGLLGIVNGLWASALLLLINSKITGVPLPFFQAYDWVLYVVLIVVSFTIAAIFQSYMIKLTERFGVEMRLGLFNKLRFTNYENVIKYGEEKIRTAMGDVTTLQHFPDFFIQGFNSLVMVVIGVAYLFYIDVIGAVLVLVFMVVLAGIYIYRNIQIRNDMHDARSLADLYHGNVLDFIRGFKEMKMDIALSDNIYHKHLKVNRMKFLKLHIRAFIRALGNELMGSYAWYIMIGIVLFVLPVVFNMSLPIMASFLVTLLFLMGPINMVIGLMDQYIRVNIAVERLNEFNEAVNTHAAVERGHGNAEEINPVFDNIRFEGIAYEYFDKNNVVTFNFKPLNLKINKGEIIFITGGNGSGKSTFINLLTGLYQPKSGDMHHNGVKITDDNAAHYRDQLACIFTDNYLFGENYLELDLTPSNKKFMNLLDKMGLSDAISIDEENNKVSHKLSKGQQKRMALIYAMLQNKEIFVFDEWAAEQDPEFRKYFYYNIIPELKKMGKTVIAVTHDDAYFNCAERIIKFDYGSVFSDEKRGANGAASVENLVLDTNP